MKGSFINELRGLFQPKWFCDSGAKKEEVKGREKKGGMKRNFIKLDSFISQAFYNLIDYGGKKGR